MVFQLFKPNSEKIHFLAFPAGVQILCPNFHFHRLTFAIFVLLQHLIVSAVFLYCSDDDTSILSKCILIK